MALVVTILLWPFALLRFYQLSFELLPLYGHFKLLLQLWSLETIAMLTILVVGPFSLLAPIVNESFLPIVMSLTLL